MAGSQSAILIAFADSFAASLVLPLLPHLAAASGAPPGAWVSILAANGVALFAAQLIWAHRISPTNASTVIALTLLAKAVLLLLLCWDFGFAALLMNRVLSGLMAGTPIAVQTLLVVTATDDRRGRLVAMSRFGTATSIGIAAGSAFAGAVVQSTWLPITFVLWAVMLVVCAALAARTRVPADADNRQAPSSQDPESRNPKLVHRPQIRMLLFVSGASRFAASCFPVLILLTAEQTGHLSFAAAAFSISALGLIEVAGQLLLPVLGARMGFIAGSVLLLSGMTVALALFEVLVSTGTLFVAIGLAGFSAGALRSLYSAWISEEGANSFARSLGVNLAINGAARAGAPVIAGLSFGYLVLTSFVVIGLVPLLCIVLTAAFLRKH